MYKGISVEGRSGKEGLLGKQYDLTGQNFGRLTVLYRDVSEKGKPWVCRCVCGGEKKVLTHPLLSGTIRSCGCLRSDHRVKNLTGQRFGRLTVRQRVRWEERGSSFWECLCDCGKICVVSSGNLKSGRTNSCGCYRAALSKKAWKEARKKRAVLYQNGTDLCQWMQDTKRNNTSGLAGVTYDRSVGLWKATIEFQKKRHYLGASREKEIAVKLRKEAKKMIFHPTPERKL